MKGIIIAAGYGTRFLPGTKTVPKEMFPLIDRPAIDFIVDEFISAGIKQILIVTSRRKKTLEDYFDREIELETVLKNENQLNKIKPPSADIYFIRQKEMLGTGHAILICREFIAQDPFVIAYPDDLVFGNISLSRQLMEVYAQTGQSVLALEEIQGDVSRYGVVDYTMQSDLIRINGVVEKPVPGKEPSRMISVGRYLFTAELINLLAAEFKNHTSGEFYHIGAINQLAKNGKLYGCRFKGNRLDIGDKLGYFEGIIRYALTNNDLKTDALALIKKYSSGI